MAKRFSSEFKEAIKKFYKGNKEASLKQARKYATKFDYTEFSQAAHDRFRKEAGVKMQRAKAGKAPAGEQEPPDRVWMDLSAGKFYTDFDSGKPGTRVAIYDRIAMGNISLAYPPEKKGARKRR